MEKIRRIFGVDINSMKFRMRCTLLVVSIFLTLAVSVLGYKVFENTPVSYTHLDVYKRQSGDRAFCEDFRRFLEREPSS